MVRADTADITESILFSADKHAEAQQKTGTVIKVIVTALSQSDSLQSK